MQFKYEDNAASLAYFMINTHHTSNDLNVLHLERREIDPMYILLVNSSSILNSSNHPIWLSFL
jgi:hypothetical protein